MKLYRLYWKLVFNAFKKKFIMLIVFACFIFLSAAFFGKRQETQENSQKSNVLFINQDADNSFIDKFYIYMKTYCTFVNMEDDRGQIEEALFYGKIDCVLTIPKDFTDNFIQNGKVDVLLESPYDNCSKTMEIAVQQYFSVAQENLKLSYSGVEDLANRTWKAVQTETDVSIYASDVVYPENFSVYLDVLAFFLICSILTVTGRVNMHFKQKNFVSRYKIAPVSMVGLKIKIVILGYLFAIVISTVFIGIGIFWFGENVFNLSCVLMAVNTYLFSICMASLSNLLACIFTSERLVDSISGFLAIILSFISGVFIKQDQLNSYVQKVASMNPVYWYVKGNDVLGKCSMIGLNEIRQFFTWAGVLVGFSAVFLVITFIICDNKLEWEK